MSNNNLYTLGIDIGSTTVKIAILNEQNEVLFSDYERHFANIQETLSDLLGRAIYKLGAITRIADHYRFRWSDPCKTLGDSFCSGSHCSIFCTSRTMLHRQTSQSNLAEKMQRLSISKEVMWNSV